MTLKFLTWISISLFILHEMDAVKTSEWKMMIFMNKLNTETGHIVFTSLHFFLYMAVFFLVEFYTPLTALIISLLFIVHFIVHQIFRKHPENRMNNTFSFSIILLLLLNSLLILFFILFRHGP